MPQFALTALASAGTAAAAGGATAAGLSGMSGLMTGLSILSTIGQGVSAYADGQAQAAQADIQRGQEMVAGQRRQAELSAQLAQVLGDNAVTFAAAGIDLNSGIAAATDARAKTRAQQEMTLDRQDSLFRQQMYRQQARAYKTKGAMGLGGALIGALQQGAQYKINLGGI